MEILFLLLSLMQVRVTLTVPVTSPSLSNYELDRITIQPDIIDTSNDEGVIQIYLRGVERTASLTCTYNSTTPQKATPLITGLLKANLNSVYAGNATTGNLEQRIYHRLVVMKEAIDVCGVSLVGTLTGVPQ